MVDDEPATPFPEPQNKTEQWLLQALNAYSEEASGKEIVDHAAWLSDQAGNGNFDRPAASAYLHKLDELDFVDSEVSAKHLGGRLYRLRDEHRAD